MAPKKVVYKSYIIRICCEDAQQKKRITVTRINETQKQYNFTSLDDLMIFLLQEIEISASESCNKDGSRRATERR